MANEYLKRTPTSTGNRKVWTVAFWHKRNATSGYNNFYTTQGSSPYLSVGNFDADGTIQVCRNESGTVTQLNSTSQFKDLGSWMHIMVVWDTTSSTSTDRAKLYVNGVLQPTSGTYPSQNYEGGVNRNVIHTIGTVLVNGVPYTPTEPKGEWTDYFFIDGQALTPDVFGFYKEGKGYISAGSTQATDFRPGQWVPKSPRIIKSEINRRGGFGVNGFYLPMNSSNNFGADFHTTPDTILRLKEALPQPKAEIDGSGDYTNALRDDPFKQYLIYAQPNVLGGLGNGYGDYSHIIRGSGSPKTITGGASGTPTISTTESLYYGSSLYFDGNDTINVETGDSNYLGRDFTIEFWVWHDAAYPANQMIYNTIPHISFGISLNRGGSGQTSLYIGNGSVWQTLDFRSGGRLYSQQWNHVAVERYNNAITIYHNGVAQATTTAVMPTGFTSQFRYGTYNNAAGEPVVGYVQDYRVYSGVAKYKGGFDVPKPYTPVGIGTWRAVPDTTANNFATLNPLTQLDNGNITYTNGNLSGYVSANTNSTTTTIGISSISSQKYYAEFRATNSSYPRIGVIDATVAQQGIFASGSGAASANNLNTSGVISWGGIGNELYINSSTPSYSAASYTNGDIIGVAYDSATRNVWFSKNGTWQNFSGSGANPATGTNPVGAVNGSDSVYFGIRPENSNIDCNFGQNPTFSGNTSAGTFTDSNGKGLFKYQPPAGFLALCSDNLPEPVISDPGKHFKTVLYTGDGNSGRSVTGLGFQPDLVWLKQRNGTAYHYLFDSVKGGDVYMWGNYLGTEESRFQKLNFDTNGFSLIDGTDGTYPDEGNTNGNTFVAWCWKAGGEAVTNTDGTITSQVSANQDAGFSIVSYTGNSTGGATVGHGLGKTPSFIIVKNRDLATSEWLTLHTSAGKTGDTTYGNEEYFMLRLNSTDARQNYGVDLIFPGNSSTFVVGGSGSQWANHSGDKYIAYCWAEIEGYSKFGSYVGNGSADGPFVYCGFKPAFVLIKCSTAAQGWYIFDNSRKSYNDDDQRALRADSTEIEGTNWPIDFLSNGLKIRYSSATNTNGQTFIFAAFAESPFTTANAK